jgi:hypothetical protein
MNTFPNGLSTRSRRLALSIFQNESDDFFKSYRIPKKAPAHPVAYLLRWLIEKDTVDAYKGLFTEAGDIWLNTTLFRFHKTAEKYGFDLLGRFASLADGEAVSIFGRASDYVFFTTTSVDQKLTSVFFNGEISTLPNPGDDRFKLKNGLTLFLELDALFMPERKAVFGRRSSTVIKSREMALVSARETQEFYRGRCRSNGDFNYLSTDSQNLAAFGRSRLNTLPLEWRS